MTLYDMCGSCNAGIRVVNGNEIQRCHKCDLFETNEDAMAAVSALLDLLHRAYTGNGSETVADAFASLSARVIVDGAK